MPRRKLDSDCQKVEQSENQRRRSKSRSTPIACIVCEKIFLDNVSLVLHFECHIKGEDSIPSQQGGDLTSLRSSSPLSLSMSTHPCSSVGIKNEALDMSYPRMNRPCPLPVSSAIIPNPAPGDASLVAMPVQNSRPPVNSSSDTQLNVSQPIHRSRMRPYGSTSSSSHPSVWSQSGARSFAYGSAPTPRSQSHNGGQARFSNCREDPHTNQIKKPIPEIIIISDDEDDNKKADEIDLTLKL